MNCEYACESLEELMQGKICGKEARAVRMHFASCPECSARLTPAQWIEILPAADAAIEPSAYFATGFRTKLESRRHPRWKWAAAFRPNRLAAAGAIAAVFLAGILIIRHPAGHPKRPDGAIESKPVETLALPEDMAVISNLDLLENFETIEDLPHLLKEVR